MVRVSSLSDLKIRTWRAIGWAAWTLAVAANLVCLVGIAAFHVASYGDSLDRAIVNRVMPFLAVATIGVGFLVIAVAKKAADEFVELKGGPRWQRIARAIGGAVFVYGMGTFFFDLVWLNACAGPALKDGRWVLEAHGHVLREITAAEAKRHGTYEFRAFTAMLLALSFGIALVLAWSAWRPTNGTAHQPTVDLRQAKAVADRSTRRSPAARAFCNLYLPPALIGSLIVLMFARMQWMQYGTLDRPWFYVSNAWTFSYIAWCHVVYQNVLGGGARRRFVNRRLVQWLTRVEWLWFFIYFVVSQWVIATDGPYVLYTTIAHMFGVLVLRSCRWRRAGIRGPRRSVEVTAR